MKEVLGSEIGLALDCGPGWTVPDAIRLARAVELLNVMWLLDLITGDYTPHVSAHLFREVTEKALTPIHIDERIYLRQNFMELIETRAVSTVGPDLAGVIAMRNPYGRPSAGLWIWRCSTPPSGTWGDASEIVPVAANNRPLSPAPSWPRSRLSL